MKVKHSLACAFVGATLSACSFQWDEPTSFTESENAMGLSPTAITPINDPNSLDASNAASKVYPPLATTTTLANDIGAAEQVLRNQTHTLNEVKVDRAGDTMTGTLTITPSTATPALVLNAAANTVAVAINGNGSGTAVDIVAGASSGGLGVTASNAFFAASISNSGTGGGLSIQGATGATTEPALSVSVGTAPTGTSPRVGTQHLGSIWLTGADPDYNVDPGEDNVIHGATITKAWVVIDTLYNVLDGYNIASITQIVGAEYRLDFVRPMANANYGVVIQQHGAPGGSGAHNGVKDANGFRFVLYQTTDKSVGFAPGCTEAYIEVVGRQ